LEQLIETGPGDLADTPAGTVNVQVPKTAGHEGEPFCPQSLERGRRPVREDAPPPEHHRKRLRTSNPIERSVQQELKRRTVKVRVCPGEEAKTPCCALSAPCGSRSTTNGPPARRPHQGECQDA